MLVNAPLVNQKTTLTNDGQPSENARGDCVPAAIEAAALAYGQGHGTTPDWWHDAAYGQGYQGAMDPMEFAPILRKFGLSVTQINHANGYALVELIRRALASGVPVLGAIPSQWGLDYSGLDMVHYAHSTHEVCFCDDTGGNLVAMNPWGGFYQSMPYAWWAIRLVYGRINPITAVGSAAWVRSIPDMANGALASATMAPGFLPIAQALDDSATFLGWDSQDVAGSLAGNLGAFAVRAVIVLIGLALILGVISYFLRTSPLVQALTPSDAGALAAALA